MPKGLIYDQSSGKEVYGGPSSGKLVYADYVYATRSQQWYKDGNNADFAAAVAAMQASSWTVGGSPISGDAGCQWRLFVNNRFTATAHMFDMLTGIAEEPAGIVGRTAESIAVMVQSLGTADFSVPPEVTARVGFVNTNDATPTDAWTWLDSATSVSFTAPAGGSWGGRVEIPVGAVLGRYLYILVSFNPYIECESSPFPSEASVHVDLHTSTALRVFF